ncbi:DUF4184 family protein [Streptomyces candidus]|uniref:DUF4184 family protein n=1 Tax=Streptomyces candidus TaxID=67283 RepID=A0A7X0H9N3_9ACTN|nr:DUF4184 family protein [Streptomyces candidus]MBB6433641.1 hypothetical protein [Streptomyces candidus]GHH35153.1 hypothetical protein GCM10018773_08410 [Streptomyces candidus]
MPFTLSHAAAVLPGIRRDGTGRGPLLPSALVAGSFAPDLTYYAASGVPGGMDFGSLTHSLLGILTVDVLCAAGLVWLWVLVRAPLVALLPRRRQGRVYGLLRGARWGAVSPALAGKFVLSAVIGALTHVTWDLFTHPGRLGMELFPALGAVYAGLPLYTYAQYGSSALAAFGLGWFVLTALRRQPADGSTTAVPLLTARQRAAGGALLVGCAVLGAVLRCVRWAAHQSVPLRPFDYVPTICFGAGAGLLVGLLLYAALVGRWRRAALREAAPRDDVARASPRTRSH